MDKKAPPERPAPLDIKDPRNYWTYLTGMAVETAAVIALMVIGLLVALLGIALWR